MTQRLAAVLRLLRPFGGSEGADTPDAQLLARFVGRRDEAAFAELVRRHGPMVLGVCRRLLRDEHGAEDAFQVTFLTLACRARTVRRGQALAAWLHRVAYHVALRVRAKELRTAAVEREAASRPRPESTVEAAWRELGPVLDDELRRLPDDLRGPLVLCGLEGKTHEDAARELGWPIGSLSKRLSRGRELLRERLARRGFVLGTTALAGVLIGEATVSVPERLLTATVRAAGQMGELSATTVALLRQVLRAMFWAKVKSVAVVLLAALLLASAIGLGMLAVGRAAPPQNLESNRPDRSDDRPGTADPDRPHASVVSFGEKKFRFSSPIHAIAYSPDGKLLVLAEHNTLRLFESVTRKELRSWDAPKDFAVKSLAFSPDNKTLATAGENPRFHQWDVATGQLVREYPGFERSTQFVAFSTDGKRLAAVGLDNPLPDKLIFRDKAGPTVRFWETATGKELQGTGDGSAAGTCVAFSPDRQLLAWGACNGTVHVRKVTGGEVFTFTDKELPANFVYSIAFSPDSKLLAAGVGSLVKLFDSRTGKELKTIGEQLRRDIPSLLVGVRLHFSPDGQTLGAVSSTSLFTLWDVASGKLSQRYFLPSLVSDLTFHPDGKTLATGGQDSTMRFWDLVNEKEEAEAGHSSAVTSVALSPDGKTVVTGCWSDGVRLWDRATGKELRVLPKMQVGHLSFGADGLVIVGVEDDRWHLYDPATGKVKDPIGKPHNAKSCLAVSADGKLLAVGNEGIRVYDLASGKEKVKLPGHGRCCLSLAFGPGGKTLLSAGEEPPDTTRDIRLQFSLKLWDLSTGKEVHILPHPAHWGIKQVAYSPDGKLAVTNTHVWDLTTGRMVRELALGVESPLFSPDGKLLALPYQHVVPKSKGWIELWDTTNWEKVAVLEGHTGMIDALAFSADRKFLVSGSEDTSARVWEIPERKK
jgi:RNA polymerase sigma factor (sigma-70 family)